MGRRDAEDFRSAGEPGDVLLVERGGDHDVPEVVGQVLRAPPWRRISASDHASTALPKSSPAWISTTRSRLAIASAFRPNQAAQRA